MLVRMSDRLARARVCIVLYPQRGGFDADVFLVGGVDVFVLFLRLFLLFT